MGNGNLISGRFHIFSIVIKIIIKDGKLFLIFEYWKSEHAADCPFDFVMFVGQHQEGWNLR
jgi:hypothetical protein